MPVLTTFWSSSGPSPLQYFTILPLPHSGQFLACLLMPSAPQDKHQAALALCETVGASHRT